MTQWHFLFGYHIHPKWSEIYVFLPFNIYLFNYPHKNDVNRIKRPKLFSGKIKGLKKKLKLKFSQDCEYS